MRGHEHFDVMLDADSAGVLRRLAFYHNVRRFFDPIREIYFGQPIGYTLGIRKNVNHIPFYDLLTIDHAERQVAGSGVYSYRLHLYFYSIFNKLLLISFLNVNCRFCHGKGSLLAAALRFM
jgi:hypothetical protein